MLKWKERMSDCESEKLISVIIPVYNTAPYLDACLSSVCAQGWKCLEILLVDDGSTDGSGAICDAWSRRDPRIRVFHKENEGVSSARNEGLTNTTGEFIAFVDSDDWIEAEMLEYLAAAIDDADMACCGFWAYPSESLDFSVEKGVKPADPCETIQAAMLIYERDGYFTSVWNKLYRRAALLRNGKPILMDSDLFWGEDEVWLAQVLGNCRKVAFVPKALYHWRPTSVSASRCPVVTEEQMTLLTAKQRAMGLLPQEVHLQELMRSRMFNDCYSLKVLAYISGDRQKYRRIDETLQSMKKAWMRSRDSSPIRKIKVHILEAEMILKLPGVLVRMTDSLKRYGIKR